MRLHRILSRGVLACALAFSLTACDSNDDDNDDDGGSGNTATGTISGDFSGSFSGNGYFGSDEEEFDIVLFDGNLTAYTENGEYIIFGRDNQSRPGEGTYSIEDVFADDLPGSDFIAVYKGPGSPEGASTRYVFSESGEVRITSSSADRIVGTYTFTGPSGSLQDIISEDTGSSTVSGSFTATRVNNLPSGPGTFTATVVD